MENYPITTQYLASKISPYSCTVDSRNCHVCGGREPNIEPRATRVINVTPQCLFSVDTVEAVEGITYEGFYIDAVRVGSKIQFTRLLSALSMFESKLRGENYSKDHKHYNKENAPWDTCQPGLYITFVVTNESKIAKPFAIQLSGRAIQ